MSISTPTFFENCVAVIPFSNKNLLKNLSYKEIELTVAPENEIAISLYKKHGYIQEKFLENEYGEGIHRYMMRKKL